MTVQLKEDEQVTMKVYNKESQSESEIVNSMQFIFDKADVCKKVSNSVKEKLTALENTYHVPTSDMEHSFVYGPKHNLQIVEWNGTPFRLIEYDQSITEYYAIANQDNHSFELYRANHLKGESELNRVDYTSASFDDVLSIDKSGKTCRITCGDGAVFEMSFNKTGSKESSFTYLDFDFESEAEAEECRQNFQKILDSYLQNK
jgi:hypothetical protein